MGMDYQPNPNGNSDRGGAGEGVDLIMSLGPLKLYGRRRRAGDPVLVAQARVRRALRRLGLSMLRAGRDDARAVRSWLAQFLRWTGL